MPPRAPALVLTVLASAVLACSLIRPPATPTGSLGSVQDLWDDVPRIDGLAAVDGDLPLFVQVAVRALVRSLTGGGEGAANWIVFNTDQTHAAVQAFYTEERMAEHAWDGSGAQTCSSGETQGLEQLGVICIFQKQVGGRWNGLIVISAANENTGGNYLAFIRIDVEATPEPAP